MCTDSESLYYNTVLLTILDYLFVSEFSFNSYIGCPPVSIPIHKWITWIHLGALLVIVCLLPTNPVWISRSNNFPCYQSDCYHLPSSNSVATSAGGWLGSSSTWILVLRQFPQHTSFPCMSLSRTDNNYQYNCKSDIRCTGRCIISLSQTTNEAKLWKLLS